MVQALSTISLSRMGAPCHDEDDERLFGGAWTSVGSSFNYAIEKKIYKVKIGATRGPVSPGKIL